jgi:hypothetical protein
MFLKTETQIIQYIRVSKLGKHHTYKRKRTVAILRCDNCDSVFKRELKKIQNKRLSNTYFHCCSNCDAKKFAQRKGIEQKQIWDMLASTELPVGKY